MWSSISFSYSVRLCFLNPNNDNCTPNNGDESTLLIDRRSESIFDNASEREVFVDGIRNSLRRLCDKKDAMLGAQKAYIRAHDSCQKARLEFETLLVEHKNKMLRDIWYLSIDCTDTTAADSIVPISLVNINDKMFNGSFRSGAELAIENVKLLGTAIKEKSSHIFSKGLEGITCKAALPCTPRKYRQCESIVEKFGFSAEGIAIPAGGDFRLPVTVSQVKMRIFSVFLHFRRLILLT